MEQHEYTTTREERDAVLAYLAEPLWLRHAQPPDVLLRVELAAVAADIQAELAAYRSREATPHPALPDLTASEREVLRLIGDGLTNKLIAARMHKAVKTIEWYKQNLTRKLGPLNRVGLARVAWEAGLEEVASE